MQATHDASLDENEAQNEQRANDHEPDNQHGEPECAHHARHVAGVLQAVGNGTFRQRKRARRVVVHTKTLLVTSRNNARP